MRKMYLLAIVALGIPNQALAAIQHFECQRYKSNCIGNDCYRLADGLRNDIHRQLLAMQEMDIIEYRVGSTEAEAFLDNEAPNAIYTRNNQYVIPYKHVSIEANLIRLEDRTKEGSVKERIEIDTVIGFYADYVLHTDNTIRDVPVGEPYTAYFGWCENVTEKRARRTGEKAAAPAPVPAAPDAPAAK